MRILFVAVSMLLIYCAGSWAYLFWDVLQSGKVIIYEPKITIILTELITSLVFVAVGLVGAVWGFNSAWRQR